eukprot:TRINITY_DN790_c0_g1_i2.p5 TRINITY_DN790_c0_g1~~TRINITY_DN790_c0_g1_i2.p5  ORF type:complete len:127 (-),score=23.13 TRINITY_DN790_c0_g1_i2:479-859(-)
MQVLNQMSKNNLTFYQRKGMWSAFLAVTVLLQVQNLLAPVYCLKSRKWSKKTGGGVLLTTDAADKPTLGEVVAVGEGELSEEGKREEVTVKPGDTVMYSKYSGAEFEEGDDKYVVLKEAELLASLS